MHSDSTTTTMRLATWNVNFRGQRIAARLGTLLHESRVDLVMLQETNPRSLDSLCIAANLDWAVTACDADVPITPELDRPGIRRPSAIAGRGPRPSELTLLPGVRLPTVAVAARIPTVAGEAWLMSYHAPPGVMWGYGKVEHALALLEWVDGTPGSIVVGADANTPRIDHPDAARVRTHWHTGDSSRLEGRTGDDVMFGGATRRHRLDDALRRYLADNPAEWAKIITERPDGPLAVSHRVGKRRYSEGVPRRYDALWVSPNIDVVNCLYEYDDAIAAGTDHALVVADLRLHAMSIPGEAHSRRPGVAARGAPR